MYICYVCNEGRPSVTSLRAHLSKHEVVGDLRPPIKCAQYSCKSSFASINNLARHLNNFHKPDENNRLTAEEIASRTTFAPVACEAACESGTDGETTAYTEMGIDGESDISSEGVALVARLRAKGNIPYSIISDIVGSFNSMASSVVSHVQSVVTRSLISSGASEDMVKCVVSDIKQNNANDPLDFLSSTYKQDNYFDNHPLAVKPETVVYGSRFETSGGISKTCYDTYEYL